VLSRIAEQMGQLVEVTTPISAIRTGNGCRHRVGYHTSPHRQARRTRWLAWIPTIICRTICPASSNPYWPANQVFHLMTLTWLRPSEPIWKQGARTMLVVRSRLRRK